jgi:hypothetical protein
LNKYERSIALLCAGNRNREKGNPDPSDGDLSRETAGCGSVSAGRVARCSRARENRRELFNRAAARTDRRRGRFGAALGARHRNRIKREDD